MRKGGRSGQRNSISHFTHFSPRKIKLDTNSLEKLLQTIILVRQARLNSMLNCAQVFYGIASFSMAYNLPRFVELEVSYHNETTLHTINNTGVPQLDYVLEIVSKYRPTKVYGIKERRECD